MTKYVSKAIEIEARKLTREDAEEIALWCGGRAIEDLDALTRDGKMIGLNIPTLEGVMRASEGDYVVKGTHGEFYPVKPHIFEAKYDEV